MREMTPMGASKMTDPAPAPAAGVAAPDAPEALAAAMPCAVPAPVHAGEAIRSTPPVVLVDPCPATLVAVWSLRRRGTELHLLSAHRLEPSLWARGVHRHHLAALEHRPRAWGARLLELAARLEPRPVLLPCSRPARDLLRDMRAMLVPHYALSHVEALDLHGYEAEDFRTERALRRTVLRGEPAFEVQVVLDAAGRCLGTCVLAWVAGVPPTVLVTSVAGEEVLERSLAWLREKRVCGYARLIWAPDRFGRIDLQAAGTMPGTSWALAAEAGVDFPLLWVASLAGIDMPPCAADRSLARSFAIAKPGFHETSLPLLPLRIPWSARDPLPFVAGLMCMLRRR